ncbi:MAG: phenylalanine--tRNA ligase subunit beta [Bacillota bacterium]
MPMLVSYEWLKELVPIGDIAPEELARRLTMAGVTVEKVVPVDQGVRGVVVGEVKTLEKHPQADKLWVTTIDVAAADGRPLTIVTGADNLTVGCRVPVAVHGSRLPGGRKIERSKLRGVPSEGMLCAMTELIQGEGHDEGEGILILGQDTPLGVDVVPLLGLDDQILELDLTVNYASHCQSMLGVAREVAAVLDRPYQPPRVYVNQEGAKRAVDLVRIEVPDPDLCPAYAARVVTDIRLRPSPDWMQRRLQRAGVRPINNIVDITNYVMIEYGQPLHAFDYDQVAERRVIVRRARPGEKLVTLDGVERELDPEMPCITDPEKVLGLAGVMGGLNSEVTAATQNILLESAYFAGGSIRRTSRAMGLRSEASARFEKGLDPNGYLPAADRAAMLIEEMKAGVVAPGVAEFKVRPFLPVNIRLRPERVNGLLGTKLSAVDMARYLRRLGFETDGVNEVRKHFSVTVPTRRPDVSEEVDLVEEVARLYGYDEIATTLPQGAMTSGGQPVLEQWRGRARRVLAGAGLNEILTDSRQTPQAHGASRWPAPPTLSTAEAAAIPGGIPIANPMTAEEGVLRSSLVPKMLEVMAYNTNRRQTDIGLFEINRVYWAKQWPLTELPVEPLMLCIGAVGQFAPKTWNSPAEEGDFFYLKGLLERLAEGLGLRAPRLVPSNLETLHPARQAAIVAALDGEAGKNGNGGKNGGGAPIGGTDADATPLGWLGEVHPAVAKAYELPGRPLILELNFERFVTLSEPRTYRSLPPFPQVERDLALVVGDDVPAAQVAEAIIAAGGKLLRTVRLFDRYAGAPVPEGQASLAYSLVYQADRTLTDAEVNAAHDKILSALEKKFGARLR